MLRSTAIVLSVCAGLLPADPAHAQSVPRPPLTWLGAGIGLGPRDIDSRVAFPITRDTANGQDLGDAGRFVTWHIEGAARVAPRAALGAEFMMLEPARGLLRGGGYRISELQEERVLTALPRFRASVSPRAAFDIVGGPGLLFWRRTDQADFDSNQRPDEVSEQSGVDWAFTVGADGVFSMGRHVGLAVGARLLWLNRQPVPELNDPQEPSTRVLVTVGMRFGR